MIVDAEKRLQSLVLLVAVSYIDGYLRGTV